MMNAPFTIEQFLQVFKDYNLSIWPMQIVFYVLSLLMIFLAIQKSKKPGVIINILLAFLWFWMGFIYHFSFFSSINKTAWVFGFFNIVQGFIFLYSGVVKSKLTYAYHPNIYGITGLIIVVYALVAYPIVGYYSGHAFPFSPTFGLPCPTTIFTFGMLLFVDKRISPWIIVIPFVWSLIGTSAALNFGIKEDAGLLFSGITTISLIIYRNRKLFPSVITK
jgi:hypothetical protein